ncbi:MAG: hypothetical protein GY773_03760, partial [Actinomycetia bacterium]|nr:hypothetical protein [Actinomycetes bacterium]
RTSWGGFLRIVALIIAVIWLIGAVRGRIYGWVDDQIEPAGDQGALVEFNIPDGASTNNVATDLVNSGIVHNATVFRYWLRCDGELSITGFLSCDGEKSFQAGDYELYENMAYEDAVALLDEGPIPIIYETFTIPEGLRLGEIVDRLVAVNDRFDRAQILEAMKNPSLVSDYVDPDAPLLLRLEGTLFPATYDIPEADLGDEARFL